MTTSLLCPDGFLSPLEIDAAVMRALAEDLGRAGDVTSIATIPEDTPARAASLIPSVPCACAATFLSSLFASSTSAFNSSKLY